MNDSGNTRLIMWVAQLLAILLGIYLGVVIFTLVTG